MRKPGLIVSHAPHWHCGASISSTMYGFVLALIPATMWGIGLYGMDAVRVVAVAIVCCVVSEALVQKMFKKPVTIDDGSAVLSGLLLGLILPASAPFWMVMVGSFVCILVGKQAYGGLGCNPFNAVLVGWAALKISWKAHLNFNLAFVNCDLHLPTQYPLGVLWKDGASALTQFSMLDLFVGREVGGIGCSSALLLGLGGAILVLRGLISWRIPVSFLAGVVVTSLIFWLADSGKYANPLFHVLAGNVMIGAFFLAPDYSSSPVCGWGMVAFGLGCGVFTVLLRTWSIYPDATFFAILLMNILSPILDMIRPKPRTQLARAS